MKNNIIAGKLLFVGGILEILNGFLHFIMPFDLVRLDVYSKLSDPAVDFILLLTVAVGICSTIFGTLAIYFAKRIKKGEIAGYYFVISQVVVWGLRLTAEFIFPVKISLFSIPNPTVFVVPVILFVLLTFIFSGLYYKKQLN